MKKYKHPIANKIADDDLISLASVKAAAELIDEYQDALERIVQARTVEDAYMIAYIALMR